MKHVLLISILGLVFAGCSSSKPKEEIPAPAPTAAPAASFLGGQAHVVFTATKGSKVAGKVHLSQENDGLHLFVDVSGLKKKSLHGFHIHENGDCSAADFSSAGGHFNPAKTEHGNLGADHHHAGDLGNLKADRKGVAKTEIVLKNVSLADISKRALIIHEKADDFKTQPTGNSGGRIACGVIEPAL